MIHLVYIYNTQQNTAGYRNRECRLSLLYVQVSGGIVQCCLKKAAAHVISTLTDGDQRLCLVSISGLLTAHNNTQGFGKLFQRAHKLHAGKYCNAPFSSS